MITNIRGRAKIYVAEAAGEVTRGFSVFNFLSFHCEKSVLFPSGNAHRLSRGIFDEGITIWMNA